MLHAELGRYPLDITIKSRMIGYWLSVVNSEDTRIAKTLYKLHFHEAANGHNLKWIIYIKNILVSTGRIDLFYKMEINHPKAVKAKRNP